MNPYYMLGVIAISMLIYAMLVATVTLTGVSVGVAMIVVYAIMFGCMLSMQKRARQAYMPQNERRRAPVLKASGIAASIGAPVSLGGLADQEAANQESSVRSAVGAADAG